MRFFEEAEGEFKLFGRATLRQGVCLQLFDDDQLLSVEACDPAFISCNDGCRGGFHDPVEELLDLLFGLAKIIAQGLGDFLRAAAGALCQRRSDIASTELSVTV